MIIPAKLSLYLSLMRADRPVGIWLLFWPCAWAVALSGMSETDWVLYPLFFIGAFAMRSAGCIVNDWVDRDIDRQVARTRMRPLAAGLLSSYDALVLLLFLLSIALLVVMWLDSDLLYYAMVALAMVALYPWMKRISWWPQLFLGLTFNLGAIFGWVAATGSLGESALWLYLAGIAWTVGYDTIYACQDMEDDLRIGVKSTAIRFGRHCRLGVGICYAITLIGLYLAMMRMGHRPDTVLLALALPALHLGWQIRQFRPDNPALCLLLFRSNHWLGLLIALSCLAMGYSF